MWQLVVGTAIGTDIKCQHVETEERQRDMHSAAPVIGSGYSDRMVRVKNYSHVRNPTRLLIFRRVDVRRPRHRARVRVHPSRVA